MLAQRSLSIVFKFFSVRPVRQFGSIPIYKSSNTSNSVAACLNESVIYYSTAPWRLLESKQSQSLSWFFTEKKYSLHSLDEHVPSVTQSTVGERFYHAGFGRRYVVWRRSIPSRDAIYHFALERDDSITQVFLTPVLCQDPKQIAHDVPVSIDTHSTQLP